MNELWHVAASALATIAAALVSVLYHLQSGRLEGMEKAHKEHEAKYESDMRDIGERLATLEERSRRNGAAGSERSH